MKRNETERDGVNMGGIRIQGICKSYGGRTVLENVSFDLPAGSRTCLMGPSGAGKTTLFRILLGLEQADAGVLSGLAGLRFGAVFQEDRLIEELSAMRNVRLTAGREVSDAYLRGELARILPPEALDLPVRKQSGGMKRRIALARAVLSPSDILILDEPFTGLDEETKSRTAAWALERLGGRTLLFSSHLAEEAGLMQARIVQLA